MERSASTNPMAEGNSSPDREPEPEGAPQRKPVPEARTAPLPRLESWAPLVCALLAAAVGSAMLIGTRDFAIDDAWIHLAYAKSARLGDGLSYNPNDWETGISSPLWVALLSVWPLSDNPVLPVKLLGLLLHAGTAWVATDLSLVLLRRRATLKRPLPVASLGLLGGVLVAGSPTLAQAATSGMEVPLAALLILLSLRAMLDPNARWSAALAAAGATLARPEALVFVAATALALLGLRRRFREEAGAGWRPLWAIGGAGIAMLAWMTYCLIVSGYPFPNTQILKGGFGQPLSGLNYLSVEVLPWQPWLVSLTGVVLLWLALRDGVLARRPEGVAIALGFLAFVLATALSRPLHPGVQFYEARYFTVVATLPLLLLPLGAAAIAVPPMGGPSVRWRLVAATAAVLPVGLLSVLQAGQLQRALADASEDTRTVHTQVAQYVAAQLPADAVVGVEGAGAIRFFAPREMTVVDLVGLNDHQAAHLHHDRRAKICYFISRNLSHMVIPEDWISAFAPAFEMRPLTSFSDPEYTQVLPARPLQIWVLEVVSAREDWAARCQ